MSSRLLRRLAFASAAVALLTVPAASPASAATVRVMQWEAFGSWGCGAGCGNGSASMSGASGSCGQTGIDLDTAGAPRVAAAYACSVSFSGTPAGVCAAGVCGVVGGHVSITVSDPNLGGTQTFDGGIDGATVSTSPLGLRVLTLRSAGVVTGAGAGAWSLEAALAGWGCSIASAECADVVPVFALTLTQTGAGR